MNLERSKMVLFNVLFIFFAVLHVGCPGATKNNQIGKIIEAFQQKDYKMALDLSSFTRESILKIQMTQPKVLWERKISEFRSGDENRIKDCQNFAKTIESSDSAINQLSNLRRFSMYDMSPWSSIKYMIYFFTAPNTWEIAEKRGENRFVIQIKYQDANTAPVVWVVTKSGLLFSSGVSKPLKEAMLTIYMTEDGYWEKCEYLEDGNVFWQ